MICLIYASAATGECGITELTEILKSSRRNNERMGITGMLLHQDGNFLQVLEGEAEVVDSLYETIALDHRHAQVTQILRQKISNRSFSHWSMGFADVSADEIANIEATNDFFQEGSCFAQLSPGKVLKLLDAFAEGRWRSTHSSRNAQNGSSLPTQNTTDPKFTFAFQPIVDVATREVYAYEALIRGIDKEPAYQVLQQVPARRMHRFDQEIRKEAIALATRLGIGCRLNLNFLPSSLYTTPGTIAATLDEATRHHLPLDRLVLEVVEREVISDQVRFARTIGQYRALGMKVAIDDFGAGYAGLGLLANFQPDQIKLDMDLVRGIERHGPRQAIVRALIQACYDLGIDVISEGVQTVDEFEWLAGAGIRLFQGYLFAKPGFESFPAINFPEMHHVDRTRKEISPSLNGTQFLMGSGN
jgi:EAL domain-containing protein (putative c-di-GMP-specific phosphodiesterase class I)